MTLSLPSPGEKQHESRSTNSAGRQGSQDAEIPSVDKIAAMLLKLNGLVMMNIISAAQASVIQRSLRTLLDIQLKRVPGDRQGLSQDALAELYRKDPRIVSLLEPFLSEQQVDWLMGVVKDDPNGQV